MKLLKRTGDKQPTGKGKWYKEEHLFGSTTYRCSRCGARFSDYREICSKCGSVNGKIKNDPVWVDEMSEYDGE